MYLQCILGTAVKALARLGEWRDNHLIGLGTVHVGYFTSDVGRAATFEVTVFPSRCHVVAKPPGQRARLEASSDAVAV